MAIISKETISPISDCNELINFVAKNRYEPENTNILEIENFQFLPEYVQILILVLDFETEYEMQGLLTILENPLGNYLSEIAFSFDKTNNYEIATLIKHVQNVLNDYNLTPSEIVNGASIDANFIEDIDKIDKKLSYLIDEKDFWENVTIFIENSMLKV